MKNTPVIFETNLENDGGIYCKMNLIKYRSFHLYRALISRNQSNLIKFVQNHLK